MRYVAAYLLARLGGNDNPDASDIKKILESVGAEVDEGKLQHVVSELRGKDIDEVMEAGRQKLAAVPSGGAVAVSASAEVAAADTGAAGKDEKKEEEKKEESEESDDDMGMGLFD